MVVCPNMFYYAHNISMEMPLCDWTVYPTSNLLYVYQNDY